MKKILLLTLALFLIFIFSGCTERENTTGQNKNPAPEIVTNETQSKNETKVDNVVLKEKANNKTAEKTVSKETATQENNQPQSNNNEFISKETATQKNSQSQSNNGFISKEKAKKIALSKARVTESKVKEFNIELDFDDDTKVWEYDIDFEVGLIEYECDIDAKTGKIIKFKSDVD